MNSLVVLGVNAAHDASACLLISGAVAAAIAEERLSRRKHHEGFPHQAVQYCLQAARLSSLRAVDCIVLNEYAQTDFTRDLVRAGFKGELITNPSHHLLHAYYAWAASGRSNTAILIVDGSGYSYGEYQRRGSPHLGAAPAYPEMEEVESQYVVRDGTIEVVDKRWGLWQASRPYYRFPSLGHMFSMASQYIFGHMCHAGKTMGLAPYGDARAFPDPIVAYGPEGLSIDTEWVLRLPTRSSRPAHLDEVCCNVAAKVQMELEQAMLYLVRQLHHRTGERHLCLSGGVALNSVTNGRILREGPFPELFVTPAANDSGIAVGAAFYGHHRLSGSLPQWSDHCDFHGREYGPDEVATALEACKPFVRQECAQDPALAAAMDIAAGRVVGWFEGPSEFGPRALGHRSILADPCRPAMRSYLNESVKYREPFRPYAASILAERANEYFDLPWSDPFMLTVAPIREEYRERIGSVCHVDGTCRVQTVPSGTKGSYRALLKALAGITGMPLVLNTSFNVRGEPIVETPADAIRCFLNCNMDVLYLEGLRITKATLAGASDPHALVPALNAGLEFESRVDLASGAWNAARHYIVTRTGYRVPISAAELRVLQLIDGMRTVAMLADHCEVAGEPVLQSLLSLQNKGLISFAWSSAKTEASGAASPVVAAPEVRTVTTLPWQFGSEHG